MPIYCTLQVGTTHGDCKRGVGVLSYDCNSTFGSSTGSGMSTTSLNALRRQRECQCGCPSIEF